MTIAPAGRPRVIVPPGWIEIPVGPDNRDTARDVFAEAWRSGPRDSIGPFIHRLEAWLVATLDDARRAGAFAVILPLGVPWQVPVSTAVSLAYADGVAASPPREDDPQFRETDAGPARRVTVQYGASAESMSPDGEDEPPLELLRTVEYTWARPDGTGLLVAFASISGQRVAEFAPVADALELLIDVMLQALTWPNEEVPS